MIMNIHFSPKFLSDKPLMTKSIKFAHPVRGEHHHIEHEHPDYPLKITTIFKKILFSTINFFKVLFQGFIDDLKLLLMSEKKINPFQ